MSGGLAFGLRDFWQRHPTQLDVRGAASTEAEVTVWLWSPEAGPMDTRFYHDGMGMDTYPEQIEGLNITYEDYEPEFGTPYGIARTSELMFWAVAVDPDGRAAGRMADGVRTPPQIVSPVGAPGRRQGVRRAVRSRPTAPPGQEDDRGPPRLPLRLYKGQVEQRHWYGFWDYGDIMHTYDADRTSGATTSAATPGTTPSSRPTCGCGSPTCAPAAPTSSASPRR